MTFIPVNRPGPIEAPRPRPRAARTSPSFIPVNRPGPIEALQPRGRRPSSGPAFIPVNRPGPIEAANVTLMYRDDAVVHPGQSTGPH